MSAAKLIELAQPKIAIIDEFGKLDAEIAAFKPKLQRHQELRETILAWHQALPAAQSAEEAGKTCKVLVMPRDNERVITVEGKRKLYRLWGASDFLERCKIALKQLPDPKDPGGKYTAQERTGPRHLKVIPLLAKAA